MIGQSETQKDNYLRSILDCGFEISRSETHGIVRVRPRKTFRLKLLREYSRREFSKTIVEKRQAEVRPETSVEVRLRKTSRCEQFSKDYSRSETGKVQMK